MSSQASSLLERPADYPRLASEAVGEETIRFHKVLHARDQIQAGAYDSPGVVESKLDDCLDALLVDVAFLMQ